MKNTYSPIRVLFIIFLLFFSFSCKKELTQEVPGISINQVSYVTATSVNCSVEITEKGGSLITDKGICWSTDPDPTFNDRKIPVSSSSDNFTVAITGLKPNTTYNVKAYAINSTGTAFSTKLSFTTLAQSPVVSTIITVCNASSVSAGGVISNDGGSEITERGFCWSTNQNPVITDNKTVSGTGTGSFSSSITGLMPGTTYYIRAYAINKIGTSYGNQMRIDTKPATPVLTTNIASDISQTTITCGGYINSDGGSVVSSRGVCWSVLQNPTVSDSKTCDGTGTGSFISSIKGLSAGTTYYIRSYATNEIGTAYGSQVTAVTAAGFPVVTTYSVAQSSSSTATAGGTVNSDGGSPVTARGICWSTSPDPTTANNKIVSGSGTGTFVCNLSGLSSGLTYYVRSFATNNIGTIYGSQQTVTIFGN